MYIKWLFAKPDNANFSFNKDSDQDGLADSWTGDSTKCEIVSEEYHPHAQKISNAIIKNYYSSPFAKHKVIIQYKFISGTTFVITLLPSTSFTITKEDNEWHFFEEEYISGTTELWIQSLGSEIIIDNLAIVSEDENYDLNSLETYTAYYKQNATNFTYNNTIREEQVESINDELFIVKPITLDYIFGSGSLVFEYIDNEQLQYLKSLQRKEIIIRTNDNEVITCRVFNISKTLWSGMQGYEQRYTVNMQVETI